MVNKPESAVCNLMLLIVVNYSVSLSDLQFVRHLGPALKYAGKVEITLYKFSRC